MNRALLVAVVLAGCKDVSKHDQPPPEPDRTPCTQLLHKLANCGRGMLGGYNRDQLRDDIAMWDSRPDSRRHLSELCAAELAHPDEDLGCGPDFDSGLKSAFNAEMPASPLPPSCQQLVALADALLFCPDVSANERQNARDHATAVGRLVDGESAGLTKMMGDTCDDDLRSLQAKAWRCLPDPPPQPAPHAPGPRIPAADEAAHTVPNAEHPAPSLSPNCLKLLSLDDTLAACKNIPDADRAQLRETIEALPATLDGVDPEVVEAVDHACSLSLDTLTQLARDCPALIDELHKTVPNVEQPPTTHR
jgi:hypothetical protein